MAGWLHGLTRVGRQLAAADLGWGAFEQASTAAPPTTIPSRPVAFLKAPITLAGVSYALEAPLPSVAFLIIKSRLHRGFSRYGYCRRSQLTPVHGLVARRPRHNSLRP